MIVGGRTAQTKQRAVRRELLALVDTLAVGDMLPSERRLAAEFGVSRPTLRAAIEELVSDGLLDRRQGSGTYVAKPKIAVPLTMTSFSEDMARRGMRAGSRVLAFRTMTAGAQIGQKLWISPIKEVFTIRRLRLADDEPMAVETLHVPKALLPDLRREDLEERSFYEHLRARGIVIGSGLETIEPTVTTEDEAAVLGVPVHAPVFLFERLTRSAEGNPVEFVRSLYRGDRYRLELELRPALR